ncbi:MAG TPA: hypothetical protein VHF27_12780 [Acidimicrobiales bacterium]|nr:hypothetical protein [Acidimicrobiales bacterium]
MGERSGEEPAFPEPPDGLPTAPQHRVVARLDGPDGVEREVLLRPGEHDLGAAGADPGHVGVARVPAGNGGRRIACSGNGKQERIGP